MRTCLLVLFLCINLSSFAQSDSVAIKAIMHQSSLFSQYYVDGDYDGMVSIYTEDGKIMPPGTEIIEGHEAIRRRWVLPEGVRVAHHQSTPVEISVHGNTAYDAGYYEGTTIRADGTSVSWKGKYVIIWSQENGQWRMKYDIWNRVD